MHNRIKYMFIILISATIFTACSGQEVNQRAFVQLMGIEKNAGNYVVSMQLYTPMSSSGSPDISQTNSSAVSGSGSTVFDAISDAELSVGKSMFLGHTKLIVLGRGINEPAKELSVFLDGTISPACPVVYSNDVFSVISIETTEGLFSADNILKTMELYIQNGKCIYTTMAEIEESIACLNTAAPLPVIKTEGSQIAFNGAVLAKNNSISGKISSDDILGVKILCNEVKGDSTITIPIYVGEKYAAVQLLKSDICKKASEENGKLKITADVCLNIHIVENKYELSREQISEAVCRNIRDSCISAFSTAVWSEECDIFGISKLVRRDCPNMIYDRDTLKNSILNINVTSKYNN